MERRKSFDLSLTRILIFLVAALTLPAALSHGQDTSDQSDTKPLQYRRALAQAVRRSAKRVLPSIVTIEVIGVSEVANSGGESEVAQDAASCGVVVDKRGYIIASEIILRRPSASLLVVMPDQTRLSAKVVSRDYHRGLVMLKVDADADWEPVDFPDNVETPVGGTVVAVGRYGADSSPMVSSGILSATGRLEGTMIQTDARVSPPFYGGALTDLYGNLIGIVVPAVAPGGAPDDTSWYDSGIGFAVPIDVVKNKLPRLLDGIDIRKGLIGIVPKSKDPYAEDTELAAVRNRSPAENAGLEPGDEITSIGNRDVRRFQEIKQALGPYDAGESIAIGYRRGDDKKSVSVTLAESIPPLQPQRLGIWVGEQAADDEDEDEDEPTQVVVKGIVPGTAADGVLKVGDVIQRVDTTQISDRSTLAQTLITALPETEIEMVVDREDDTLTLSIQPDAIAGSVLQDTLTDWQDKAQENKWDIQKLRLPDVPNLAAYTAPDPKSVSADQGLTLLVLLMPPKQREPETFLQSWRDVAGRMGVVVCAIASEDEKRWQPREVDVVARMVTMMQQRVPLAVSAVASQGVLDGEDASVADSMALAIAFSDRVTAAGIAISDETRPPGVRLRENEPDRALQFLLPIADLEDGPTWLSPLTKSGYPIVLGEKIDRKTLLRWTRLLQVI